MKKCQYIFSIFVESYGNILELIQSTGCWKKQLALKCHHLILDDYHNFKAEL